MVDTALTDQGDLDRLAVRSGLRPAGARPTLPAYVRQVWRFRHFISGYADAKLVASFNSARLGQLWQVLTPVLNAGVYYLVFGIVLDTRRPVPNFLAYLFVGLFVFGFTQAVVQHAAKAISGNLGLIRVLRFPRACLPVAVVVTQLKLMVTALVVLAAIVVISGEPVTARWTLLVPVMVLLSGFNLGLALVVARLGATMTDLPHIVPFVLRAWMYGSGVLYSVANFEAHLPHAVAAVMEGNPMLVYVELARSALLTGEPATSSPWQLWSAGALWAVVASAVGLLYFWRAEHEYGRG